MYNDYGLTVSQIKTKLWIAYKGIFMPTLLFFLSIFSFQADPISVDQPQYKTGSCVAGLERPKCHAFE